jgi:uncharacterized membrane protein
MRHPAWVRRFLTPDDLEAVTYAVSRAEAGPSGEIRVHLDATCPGDPVTRATRVFEDLGLHRTAERNAVLLYVAIEDRKLAVLGDAGVHIRVPPGYWATLTAALERHFREGQPRQGLIEVVGELGVLLAQHFPRRPDDRNELADDVSLG